MDVRRVGEALLRSHSTNLVSAVSRPSQQQCSRFLYNRRSVSRHISETSRRSFTSSSSRSQQNAPKDDAPQSHQSAQQASMSGSQQPQQSNGKIVELRSLLDSTPYRSSSSAETTWRTGGGGNEGRKSLFNFPSLLKASTANNSLEDAAGKRESSLAKSSTNAALRQMLGATALFGRTQVARSSAWHFPPEGAVQTATKQALMEPPDASNLPRLGPSWGRTVPVENNDLVGALRKMDVRINVNGIRKAYHAQKFHERPGLKRKRLASQRWRNRFMQGFKEMVRTVQHLKRQGW